jgi:hypothetical protein
MLMCQYIINIKARSTFATKLKILIKLMQSLIYVIAKLNMNMYDYITNNYESLNVASLCVCCDCLYKYSPNKIRDWCDNGKTAICPYCWNDTVLVAPELSKLYTEDNVNE